MAWLSFVVGVHFFALAVHFGLRFFHLLGAAIALCGVVGLVIAFAEGPAAAVAVVAGIIPGAVLMAFAARGLRTRAALAQDWRGRPLARPASRHHHR